MARQSSTQKQSQKRQDFLYRLLASRRFPMLCSDMAVAMNDAKIDDTVGWIHNDIYRTIKIMERKGLVTVNDNFGWSIKK